jgi:AcrR family transcriptional regulator
MEGLCMRDNKDDRRVKYTKMVLKDSFIKLLTKKDISRITIKEICEYADINRATFYSHYIDQYDLMKKIEDELLDNISTHLSVLEELGTNLNSVETIEKILDYIKENAQLCKLLLSERGDLSFQKKVMIFVYDIVMSNLSSIGIIDKEDAEYIYSFTITGSVGIIQKWLNDDMKKSTGYMAKMVIRLTSGSPAAFVSFSK